jgi:hypothetical protein
MRYREYRQIIEGDSSEWLGKAKEISMEHTPVSFFSIPIPYLEEVK